MEEGGGGGVVCVCVILGGRDVVFLSLGEGERGGGGAWCVFLSWEGRGVCSVSAHQRPSAPAPWRPLAPVGTRWHPLTPSAL